MKMTLTLAMLLIVASFSFADVVVVGEDTTTLTDWRTAAALETDNQYGTDGYVIYGIDAPDDNWSGNGYDASSVTAADVAADSQIVLPGYIGDISLAANNTGRWSGNGNYGTMQNPANGDALENTPLLAWATGDVYNFTITRATNTAFRLTFLMNDGDGADHLWDTTVDAQAAGSAAIVGATENGSGNATYHVYDIDAGTDDILITLLRTSGGGNPGGITGFAFDAFGGFVPGAVPATFLSIAPASVGTNVMRVVINAPSSASRYWPKASLSLESEPWEGVAHSVDGFAPWYVTNLSYVTEFESTTNEVIYVHAADAVKFFGMGGE